MIGRAFATVAVAAAGLSAFGETLTWTGEESSDWSEAGNWSPAQAPAAGDALVIPAGLEVYPQLAPNAGYMVTHNGDARKVRADADGKLVFSAEFQNGLEPDSFAVNGLGGFMLMVR